LEHIYYFLKPGLRDAMFLLFFDYSGQRLYYFTIWISANGCC
jgi:hypothetical protein